MRISYNWLKDFLPDLQQTPEEIAQLLTSRSFETVIADKLGIDPNIVVVKITQIGKHPNADRLRLATITDGNKETTVVCGAPNIEVGQTVPYSPPGAMVHDGKGGQFAVQEATIRGQKSPGMLNSLRELGLHAEHGGIWILPAGLPLGSRLADHVPADTVLEADITPNRAHDCLGHLGIAREVAALLKTTPKEPDIAALPDSPGSWQVTIENPADSPRYIVVGLEDVDLAPSPLWMQVRLLAAGGKPKNNLVDISNYVLFETGNPTHVFDADKLSKKEITVRRARKDETITALDDIEYRLTDDDVVITNNSAPIAIAGVMGGINPGVQENTRNIVLEVANFRPYAIQETSRRLNLRSESSVRFSKGIHPHTAELAAGRAVYLLQEVAGANAVAHMDVYPQPRPKTVVTVRPSRFSHIAGVAIEADEAADILRRLRFTIDDTTTVWEVTVPYDRLDIEGEHDIAEEVIRVFGLENIPVGNRAPAGNKPLSGEIVLRERLRDNLVAIGFTETLAYSFEPISYAEMLGVSSIQHLVLSNPPAPELSNLRVSLLPGLLANLVTNRTIFLRNAGRGKESALFEVGNVYLPGPGGRTVGVCESLHVAGVVAGALPDTDTILTSIADAFGVGPAVVLQTGSIRPLAAEIQRSIKYRTPVLTFEFNLSELVHHADSGITWQRTGAAEAVQFVPYSKYPSVTRDISMLVAPDVSVEAAQGLIERVGGELVVDVDLFDELEWKNTGQKSIAFHVEYQAFDRTLTDAEVDEIHTKITGALQNELQGDIR